jgi:hypothetical protein
MENEGTVHPHLASLSTSRRERLAELEGLRTDADPPVNTEQITRDVYQIHPDLQATESSFDCEPKKLSTSYLLWLPPMGLVGAHHYYLRNKFMAIFCTLTLGGVGVIWLVDLVRMKTLVDRENARQRTHKRFHHVDDGYLLHTPWGFLGMHHFYMGNSNIKTGFFYMFTGGFFGMLWLMDIFFLPGLIEESNEQNEEYVAQGTYVPRAEVQAELPPVQMEWSTWTTSSSASYQYAFDYSVPPPSYDSVLESDSSMFSTVPCTQIFDSAMHY